MAVGLLTVMFLSFVVQIVARYVINAPLGWTLELCLTMWLWVVFWGTAFCLRDRDHVKFDILYLAVPPHVRKWFAIISSVAIVVGLLASAPASWDYISFLYIKKSPTLRIRLNYVFMVYMIFLVAVVIRYALRIPRLLREGAPEDRPKDHLEVEVRSPQRAGGGPDGR
ncbi:MAG TPA: TRAP transporter small permease [Woeseiaceae bacterium]|nr:TRAP transporter small permease [Woeseiaceae bacterium]